MKIILSRKGFDSSSGGCPSPLFPDGQLYSLPIPDAAAAVRYCDLAPAGIASKGLVSQLTGRRHASRLGAHLDPDLRASALPRPEGWRPSLGQAGSAQGHLRNQLVGAGDLFLFFGLFRPVERFRGRWQFRRAEPARHVLWGWLQVDRVCPVAELTATERLWLAGHPHLQQQLTNNTLYVGRRQLVVNGVRQNAAGAGVFTHFAGSLQLSDPDCVSPRQWRLPAGFYPDNDLPPLSYHHNPGVWRRQGGHCYLHSAARGQEFVLQADYYPRVLSWACQLIGQSGCDSFTV
ncbi:hypothetical protein [Pseudomaricurvus sp. HS19]|uniref:Nmad3 family putative nucleotide modification protein n=1 Tax=Pseudomaricurvus sp. HS19 TaxID=2692626 RepID=UPI00136861C0|nr:hypothetical protein [Pseudomaricurvus sp. HS19]